PSAAAALYALYPKRGVPRRVECLSVSIVAKRMHLKKIAVVITDVERFQPRLPIEHAHEHRERLHARFERSRIGDLRARYPLDRGLDRCAQVQNLAAALALDAIEQVFGGGDQDFLPLQVTARD